MRLSGISQPPAPGPPFLSPEEFPARNQPRPGQTPAEGKTEGQDTVADMDRSIRKSQECFHAGYSSCRPDASEIRPQSHCHQTSTLLEQDPSRSQPIRDPLRVAVTPTWYLV